MKKISHTFNIFSTNIAKQIDSRFSAIEKEMVTSVKEAMKSEKELMEFEILTSLFLKRNEKIENEIKMEKELYWKKALKKANGDVEKALKIFDEEYLHL